MKTLTAVITLFTLGMMMLTSCGGSGGESGAVPAQITSDKNITDFVVNGVHGTITSNTVTLTLPFGTDLSALTPAISITGESISPSSGVTGDFTNPVVYTVTAADGSTFNYTVTITAALASANVITDFVILGVHGTITADTITLTLPYNTDLTNLTPAITISGAGVNPLSNTAQNFSAPVVYTVTASDSSTGIYTVTVTTAANNAKDITGFTILGVPGTITADTVSVILPYETDVTALIPSITITGTSVAPADGAAQDFSSPVLYTVTAADTSSKNYTVTVIPNYVSMGSSAAFAVFGGSSGMTNQGLSTVITGNIGTTAASTLVTGFHDAINSFTETALNTGLVSGSIFSNVPSPGTADSFAAATLARSDALAAYNFLFNLTGAAAIPDQLGATTLNPGIYIPNTSAFLITGGNLTLDAQGNINAVWVFQSPSSLTVGDAGASRSVTLINGADAKNVYWIAGTAATINPAGGGVMAGTIISDTGGITFSTADVVTLTTLNGRAISLSASVTMVNTIINVPGM